MAEDYSRACDAPREFHAGGVVVLVGRLCPADVGYLQAWFKTRLVSPYVAARDAMLALGGEASEDDRKAVWIPAAEEAIETWPPSLNSEAGIALLFSDEGKARFLFTLARRHNRRLTLDRCRAIANVMTADDCGRLAEMCVMPGEIGDRIQPPEEWDDSPSKPYTEVRAMLCEMYPGWTFAMIDEMSFDAIRDACMRGKPPEFPIRTASEAQDMIVNWRRYYRGI